MQVDNDDKEYYYFSRMDNGCLSVSPSFENKRYQDGKEIIVCTRGVSMKMGDSSDLKIDKKVETQDGLEIHLRTTDKAEQEIKAYFYEDSRNITSLTVQRWMTKSGKPHKEYMVLYGDQLDLLLKFTKALHGIPLNGKGGVKIPLELALQKIDKQEELNSDNVKKYLHEHPELIKSIIENEIEEGDLVALSYRKKQLEEFKLLLSSNNAQESDWQKFFEKNTWIFGYGLSYIFQTGLNDKKIEQVVSGYDFNSGGKRVDGLLKTAGIINSLCFIEIKTHKTDLLESRPYRKGCWAISSELSGAVSQIQNTISLATKNIYDKIQIKNDKGDLTGEEIFNFHPKAFLVVGKLDEFKSDHGVNSDKYRSFELFRKNVFSPEIITFDELYERAKFIVSQHDVNLKEDGGNNG